MKRFALVLLLPLLLTGCATIVGSDDEAVYIDSVPSNTPFIVADSAGNIVAKGSTPTSVILQKNDGSYLGKREYTLTVKHDGYHSSIVPLEYRLSYWYTFGNLIFGGIPGWFIVDPYSGGMYTLKENRLNVILRQCAPGPFRYMCT